VTTIPTRWARVFGAALLGIAGLALPTVAQSAGAQARATASAAQIEVTPVRANIYVLSGAGANIIASVGRDGVFLVDTGLEQNVEAMLAALAQLQKMIDFSRPPAERFGAEGNIATLLEPYYRSEPPKPIRYIANTTFALDHIGGNAKLRAAGKTFTGGNVAGEIDVTSEGAAILGYEKLLDRMEQAKLPSQGLPTESFFGDHMKLSQFFNGEGVVLYHAPAASTDADSIVNFRGSDVFATGDIFRMSAFPKIDIERGGSIQGVLAALNRLIDMSVAEFRTEGGTLVIGGHGRVGDLADLTYYRDMSTIIRDRVQDLIKKGMTLAQVKAAKPSEDWDGRFGGDPSWTPDMFVEAIFKSLTAPPRK
jgi:glyoxylase-like metal-dependent hydrolase (beta-lactamase superfamily II)